jgi:hypothetical protein
MVLQKVTKNSEKVLWMRILGASATRARSFHSQEKKLFAPTDWGLSSNNNLHLYFAAATACSRSFLVDVAWVTSLSKFVFKHYPLIFVFYLCNLSFFNYLRHQAITLHIYTLHLILINQY